MDSGAALITTALIGAMVADMMLMVEDHPLAMVLMGLSAVTGAVASIWGISGYGGFDQTVRLVCAGALVFNPLGIAVLIGLYWVLSNG